MPALRHDLFGSFYFDFEVTALVVFYWLKSDRGRNYEPKLFADEV